MHIKTNLKKTDLGYDKCANTKKHKPKLTDSYEKC